MKKYLIISSLFLFLTNNTLALSANQCIEYQDGQYGGSFFVNICNKKVDPISFCWESVQSSCSCNKGGGCSTGVGAGGKSVISGPGRKGYTEIKWNACFFDDWVKGNCVPRKYR